VDSGLVNVYLAPFDRAGGPIQGACGIPLANWFSQAAVGLKALGYSDKGRLHGLHQTRYRISPAVTPRTSVRLRRMKIYFQEGISWFVQKVSELQNCHAGASEITCTLIGFPL